MNLVDKIEWKENYLDAIIVDMNNINENFSKQLLFSLKPGGHIITINDKIKYHRNTIALEDMGFEIRDQIIWFFGNDNKSLCLGRKPLSEKTIVDNVIKWGTGGINVDGCRIEGIDPANAKRLGKEYTNDNTNEGEVFDTLNKTAIVGGSLDGRFPANILFDETAAEMLDKQMPFTSVTGKRSQKSIDNCIESRKESKGKTQCDTGGNITKITEYANDKGGASRFFFNAKNYGGREDFFIYKEKNIIIWNTKSLNTQEYKMEECIEVSDALRQARENILQKPELYGNNTMVKYLLNTISITKMKTHSIMTFSILNVYTKMNIGHFTLMIEEKQSHLLMEENILNVQIVNNQNALVSSIKTNQEVLATIVNYVLEEDLENGETVIENTITNTTENIEQSRFRYIAKVSKKERNLGLDGFEDKVSQLNSGGIGRKVSVEKRLENNGENAPTMKNTHPTLKPINLMTYLCRLITPPGGIILDPFMGSGSTGISACLEGFRFVGMELDEDYFKIAEARVNNFEEYRKLLK